MAKEIQMWADKANNIKGYPRTKAECVYTSSGKKVENEINRIETSLENKANQSNTYTKEETDNRIATIPKGDKGDKGEPGTASVAISDTDTNTTQTWSSSKIETELTNSQIRFKNSEWITNTVFDTITSTTTSAIWLVYQFDITQYILNEIENVECNFNAYITDANIKQIKCSLYTNNNPSATVITGGEVKNGKIIDINSDITQYSFTATGVSTANKYLKVLVGVVLNDTSKPFTLNISDVNIKVATNKLTTHSEVVPYNNSSITNIIRGVKLDNQLLTVKDINEIGSNINFINTLDSKIDEKTNNIKMYEVFDINTWDSTEGYFIYSFDVSELNAGFVSIEFDLDDMLGNLNGVGTSIYMNNDDSVEVITGGVSFTTKDIFPLYDGKCTYGKVKGFSLNTNYKYLKIVILPQKSDDKYYVKCKIRNIKIKAGSQSVTNLKGIGSYRYSAKIINSLIDEMQIVNYELLTNEINKGSNSQWKNKKWLVIGDSITDKTNHATINYYDYIANDIGCNIVNNGKNGTGYLTSFASNSSLLDRLSTLPDDVDLITVFLGTNDFGSSKLLGEFGASDTSTFYGAVNKCLNDLTTKYADKKIAVFTPLRRINDNVNNAASLILNDYRNAIIDVCEYYSIPVLDLYKCSGISIYNTSSKLSLTTDGLHPNNEGHKKISNVIKCFIDSI